MAQAKHVDSRQLCFHCGDHCVEDIEFSNKHFCCHGCLAVYQLLADTGLTNYYELANNPGVKQRESHDQRYNYLDTPAVEEQLLLFQDPKTKRVRIDIPAIHCSSCIWLLENLHQLDSGITNSEVSFSKRQLTLDYDPSLTKLSKIANLLLILGYPPSINLGSSTKPVENTQGSLIMKLGVAGFAFGNIMLLSFPEYFGFEVEADFQSFFSLISFVLALPVVFYSASGYFISAWKGTRQGFISIDVPIVLGIIALFFRSSYEVIWQIGSGYFDSLSGLVFFLLIGRWVQNRSYHKLSFDRDYRSYFPLAVLKLTATGEQVPTPVQDLNVKDQVLIRNREVIPADCQLLDQSAAIDYSFVTGESDFVEKTKNSKIYAGARVIGKAAHFSVLKPVSQSYLSSLWNKFNTNIKAENERLIDRISRYFTFIILSIAVVALAFWWGQTPSKAVQVFTAVLIVACPCALALATPFTLSAALNVLGRNRFYLKGANVIEKLWKIDHLVFDKTGTITEAGNGNIRYHGDPLAVEDIAVLGAMTTNSTHPLSIRIKQHLSDKMNPEKLDSFKETPGSGLEATCNGKVFRLGSAKFVGLNNERNTDQASMVYIGINGEPRGYFEIKNRPRPGLPGAISRLSRKYSLDVISGDNNREKSVLTNIFPPNTKFQFHQKPHQKLERIQALQKQGKVMMIGDGLNDAGALGQSDVGVAVTEDITSFTPASDAIIEGTKLSLLDHYLTFARKTRTVLAAGFIISFLYNVVGLGFAVSGHLSPLVAAILMPISSVTVVATATLGVKFVAYRMNLL